MKTFTASLASILFCMIVVSGSALPSRHGTLSSHQKYQDIPINIQTEEENNNAEIACISPNTNIYEIFHKAQKLAKGNDMKCHFYIHNKENYEYIGTLNINKQLFEELLMKYDHWLLTKLNANKNELKDVKDTVDNSYEAIDEEYSDDSRIHDDKKSSHHTTYRHKTHHSKDNHHRKEIDERKVKSKHYIELDPRYDDTHKYFEVFLPKTKHKNDPRKIYINVDKDNKEFLLFDNEKHREMNYKPIKIGLRELSAIADVIFNKAEAGKTVFTVNDENIEEPERYEIKKVDYERNDEEDEKDVDLDPTTSKTHETDVVDNENNYTELNDTDVDDHDIENDNTTNDLDFNNTGTNTFDDLSHVKNENKHRIIDIKDTCLLLDNNNTEVCSNNDEVENNDTELHNYDNNDDFDNDTNAQVEYIEQIDKVSAIDENNYISNKENYKVSSQQDNTDDIVFRRSQTNENRFEVKENYAPVQECNQRFGTSYNNQPATPNPKVLNIQTNFPTPCTMTNILNNSRNDPSNLDFNSLADSTALKAIEPCFSSLEELKLPNDVLANILPELSSESSLYAFPNAPCPSSNSMPIQNDVKFDTVTSNPLNFGHNLPPCELGNVFNQKNRIPLKTNANLPNIGIVCNQNGILNSLPNINNNYNALYQNPFLQSTPCIPKEFSKNPCLLPNSYSGIKNPYATLATKPMSPLNYPNIKSNFLPNPFSYPQYFNQKRPCLPFSSTGQNPNLIGANFQKESPLKLPSINPCFPNKLFESAKKYNPYDIHLSLDEDSTVDHTKYGYLTEMPLTKLPNKPSFKLTNDNNQLFKSSDQSLLQSSLSKPSMSISSSFEDENRNFLDKTSQIHSKLDSSLSGQHIDLGSSQFSPDSTNFNNANVISDTDIKSLIKILSQTGNSIHSLEETGLIAPETLDASLVGFNLDLNKSIGDFISSTSASSTIPSSSTSLSSLDSSLIGSSLHLDKSSTNLRFPLDSSLIGQNLELNKSQGTLMSSTLTASNESLSHLNGVNALSNEELHVSNNLESSLIGPGLRLDKESSIIKPSSSNLDLNVLSGSYPSTNISPTHSNEINTSVKGSMPSQFLDATLIGPGLKLNNLTDRLTNTNVLSTDLNEINTLGDQGSNYLDTSLIGPELNIDGTSVLTTQDGITTPFSIKEETQFRTQSEGHNLVLDNSLIGPSLETLSPELKLDNRVQILDKNDTTNPLIVHNDNNNLNTVEDSLSESVADTLGDIKEKLDLEDDIAIISNEDLPYNAETNETTLVLNTDNDVNSNINETKLPGDTVQLNDDLVDELPLDESNRINADLSNTETQIDNPMNIINTTNEDLQPTDVLQPELDLNSTAEGGESNANVEFQEPSAPILNGTSDLDKGTIDSDLHEEVNIPNDVDNGESKITNTQLNIDEDALNAIISENNITLEPHENVKLIDVTNTTDKDSKLDENPDDYVVLYTTNMKDGNLLTKINETVKSNDSLEGQIKKNNITEPDIVNNDINTTLPAEIMTNPSSVEEAQRPALDTHEMLIDDIKPINEVMDIESYKDANKITNPITNEDTNNDKNVLTQESRRSEPNDEVIVLDSALIGPSLDLSKETALNLIGGKVDSSLTGPSLFQEIGRMEKFPFVTVNNIPDRYLTSASLFQDRIKEMNPTINSNLHLDSSLIVPGLNLDTDANLGKNIGGDSFNLDIGGGLTNNIVNDRFFDHTLIGSSLPVEKIVNPLAFYEDSNRIQHAILSILNSEEKMDNSLKGADLLTLSKNGEKNLAFEQSPELDKTRITSLDSFGTKNGYNFNYEQPMEYTPSISGLELPFNWTSSSMTPSISSPPILPYSYSSGSTPVEYAPSTSGLGLPFDWTASSMKPSISSTPMSSYSSLSSLTPMEYAPSTLGLGLPFDWTASSMKPGFSSTHMSPYSLLSSPTPLEYVPSALGIGLPFDWTSSPMQSSIQISSTPMSSYPSLSSPTPLEYAASTSGIGSPFDWAASYMKPCVSSTPTSPYSSLSTPTPIEYAPSALGIRLPFDCTASSMKPSISSTPVLPYSYSSRPTSKEYAPSTFSLGLPFDRSASPTPFLPYSSLSTPSYSNILPATYPLSYPYTSDYQSPLVQASKPYKTAISLKQNFPNTFIIPKPSPSICFNPTLTDNTLPSISESNPFLPLSRMPGSKPISTFNPFSTPPSSLSLVKPCETLTLPTKSLLKDNSFSNPKPYMNSLMPSLPSDLKRPYLPESSSSTYASKPYLPLAPKAITNMISTISSSSPCIIPKPCITNNNFLPSPQNLSSITNAIPSLDVQTMPLNNLLNTSPSLPDEKPLHFLPQSLSFLDQEHPSLQSIKLASSSMQASNPRYTSKSFFAFQKPPFTSTLNSLPSFNIELLKPQNNQFISSTPSSPISSFTQLDSPVNKWTIPLPTTSVQNFATPISLTPEFSKISTGVPENKSFFQIPSNIPINIPFLEWNTLVPKENIPTLSKPSFPIQFLKQESSVTDSAKESLLLKEIKSLFDKSRTDLSRDGYTSNIVHPSIAETLSTSSLNSMPLQTEFKMQTASPFSSKNQIMSTLSTNKIIFDEKLKLSPEYLDSSLPCNMREDNEVIQNKTPILQYKELDKNLIVDKEAVDEIVRLLERDKQSRSIHNFETNAILSLKKPMYSISTGNLGSCEIDSRNEISMANPMTFVKPIYGVNNFKSPYPWYNFAPASFKPYTTDDIVSFSIPSSVPCANYFDFPKSSLAPIEYEPYDFNDKTPIPVSRPVSFARPNVLTNTQSPYANSFIVPFLQSLSISLPCKPLTSTLPIKSSSFPSSQPLPNAFRPFSPLTETKLTSLPPMPGLPSEFSPSSQVLGSKSPSLATSNEVESTSIPLSELSESYSSIPDNIETFSPETSILPNSQLIPLSLVKSQTETIAPTTENEDIVPKTDNFKWSDVDLDKFEPYKDEIETNLAQTEENDRFYYSNDFFDKYHEGAFIVEPEELNYIENENDLQPSVTLDKDAFREAVSTQPLIPPFKEGIPQIRLDNLHTETKTPINYATPITTLSAPPLEALSLAPLIYKSMLDDIEAPSMNYATRITTLSAPPLKRLSLTPPALFVNPFKTLPICGPPLLSSSPSSSSTTFESPLLDYRPSLINSSSYSPYISSINYNTPCLPANLIKPCSTLPVQNTPTLYATVPKSSFSSPEPYTSYHNAKILTPNAVPFTNSILNDLRPVDFNPYNAFDKTPISMPKSVPCATQSIGVNTLNSPISSPRKYEPCATDYRTPICSSSPLSAPNTASLPPGSFVSYLPKPPPHFSSSPISYTNVPISLTSSLSYTNMPTSLTTPSLNTLQYSSPQPFQPLPVFTKPTPPSAILSSQIKLPSAPYESQPCVSVNKVLNPTPSITSSLSPAPCSLQTIPLSSSQIKEYPILDIPRTPFESKPCVSIKTVLNPSSSVTPCSVLSLPYDSSMPSSTKAFESPKLPCITTAPLLPASELPSTSIPMSFSPKLASASPRITPVSTYPSLSVSQLPSLPNPIPSIETSTFTPNYPSMTLPISPLTSSAKPLDTKPSFTSFIQSPYSPPILSKPVFNPSTASSSPFTQSLGLPSNLNFPSSKTPSTMTPVFQNMPSMSSHLLISSAPSSKPDINRNYAPKPCKVNKNLDLLSPNEYAPFELEYKDRNSVSSIKNPFFKSIESNYRYTAPIETSPKIPLSNVLNPFISSVKTNPNSCTPTVQTPPLISATPSLITLKSPSIIEIPVENTLIRNNQQSLPFLTKPSHLISLTPSFYSSKSPCITEMPIGNTPSKTYTQTLPFLSNTENTQTIVPTTTNAQNLPFVSNMPCLSTPCLKLLIPRTESFINSPCTNPITSPPEPFSSGFSRNISPIEVPSSTFMPSSISSYNLIKPITTKPYQPPSIQISVPEYSPTNNFANIPINISPILPKPVPICITPPKPYPPMFEPTFASNSQTYSPTQLLSSTIPLSNTNPMYLTPELLQSPTPNICSVLMKSPTVSQTQSLPCMPLFSSLISPLADKTLVCPQAITNPPCETVEPTPIFTSSLKSPSMQETVIPSPTLSQPSSLVLCGTKSPIMSSPSLQQSLIPILSNYQSPAGSNLNLPHLPCYQPLTSFLSSPKSPARPLNYPQSQYLTFPSDVPENTEYYPPTPNPTQMPPFFLTPQDYNLIQTPTLFSASNYQPCVQPTLPNKEVNIITPVEYLPESRVKDKEDLITLDDFNNLPNELKGYNYKPYIIEENMPEFEKDFELEERDFDNNNPYTETENLHDTINDYNNDDENLEDIHYTDKYTQAFDTNYLINNNYITQEPMKITYDTRQDEKKIDASDLTNIPNDYHHFIPESEINEQENNPESLKETQYYIDEIHPEITNTNPLIDNDYNKDLFNIQNRPNLLPGQFNLDNTNLNLPKTDYFEEIPDDLNYSGYKTYQMPLTNLRNRPPLIFNPNNAYTDVNYYNPTNMYSAIQDSITEIPKQPELNLNHLNLSPKLTNTNALKDNLINDLKENDISNLNDESITDITKQPELNLNNQNLSPKLTNTNPLKDILIKYLKENNITDLKDEITIPIGNIAFIDDEDKPIADNIDLKNPDLNLKMWKSNVKIVNAEIKVKCKEVTVNNFMPIQKSNSFEDYRDIVKRYIEDKYGHCILMDKPYTKETRYSVLNDFDPSAVGYSFNLLWPTHYA